MCMHAYVYVCAFLLNMSFFMWSTANLELISVLISIISPVEEVKTSQFQTNITFHQKEDRCLSNRFEWIVFSHWDVEVNWTGFEYMECEHLIVFNRIKNVTNNCNIHIEEGKYVYTDITQTKINVLELTKKVKKKNGSKSVEN